MTTPQQAPPETDPNDLHRTLGTLQEAQRQSEKRADDHHAQINQRFDDFRAESNQRFDDFRAESNHRFDRLDQGQSEIRQELREHKQETTSRIDRLFYTVIAVGAGIIIAIVTTSLLG